MIGRFLKVSMPLQKRLFLNSDLLMVILTPRLSPNSSMYDEAPDVDGYTTAMLLVWTLMSEA